MKQIETMKDKLLNAAGKYFDYQKYWIILSELEEEYDQSLEIYNLDIWYGKSSGTIRDKAAHMLRVTEKLFRDLFDNAEKELMNVLEEIISYEMEEQKQIWRNKMFVNKSKFDKEKLEEKLLMCDEHPYTQDEALILFENIVQQVAKAIE